MMNAKENGQYPNAVWYFRAGTDATKKSFESTEADGWSCRPGAHCCAMGKLIFKSTNMDNRMVSGDRPDNTWLHIKKNLQIVHFACQAK